MHETKFKWLKGSLPGWLGTILLGLVCFFGKQLVDELDQTHHMVHDHDVMIKLLADRADRQDQEFVAAQKETSRILASLSALLDQKTLR